MTQRQGERGGAPSSPKTVGLENCGLKVWRACVCVCMCVSALPIKVDVKKTVHRSRTTLEAESNQPI